MSSTPSSELPLREIPGSYGLPFFGAIKDRWDFFYLQKRDLFFESRIVKYNSTIFRVNMPPGPWISSDPRVICLLDAKSFPVLFDNTKVEKSDLFVGTYMPNLALYGGHRCCAYLDPSDPKHGTLKTLLLTVLSSRHKEMIPLLQSGLQGLFSKLDDQLSSKGRAEYAPLNDEFSLEFFFRLFCDGQRPSDTKLENEGVSLMKKWAYFQLAPILTLGLPKLLSPAEDLVAHTFRLPAFLVTKDYKKMYDAFYSAGTTFLDKGESMGLTREEACHNLIFFAGFNAHFGISRWFPSLLKWISRAGESLHRDLAEEIRTIVKAEGGVTINAINKMALTKSVVYEGLRIQPPLPYQYGKAKKDLVVQSHDAEFKIKKGEMIFGYQPIVTKDPKIFVDPQNFVGDRFLGEDGEKLKKYVFWSNGWATDSPTPDNKQCPGKNVVELMSSVLLVEFFLRYDTFSAEIGTSQGVETVTFVSLKKANST